MICLGYSTLAATGLNFFVWGDHLFAGGASPVIMWFLFGILFGAMIGSLIFWRKYHVEFKWCLVTIIPFFSILLLLQLLSDPLQSFTPRPLAIAVDSSKTNETVSQPVQPLKRKKHKAAKVNIQTDAVSPGTQTSTNIQDCAKQTGSISVNVRTDSVNVYYRTAGYQNGPWGPWKSKFILQQGQFSLTDEEIIKANSLQYYYECKSVLTRSAQNPFTRHLCEGPLTIETY